MIPQLAAIADERALTARVATEPAAFATLYDRYFPRVYNYVRYRVSSAQVADDLVSRVFEKALARIETYSADRGPFVVWLLTIARNTVTDHLRSLQRHPWFPLEPLQRHTSGEVQPEEYVLRRERNTELLDAVARLKDRERDIIALKFAVGLTNRRIAALTGLTENHVAVILYRAMRKLRTDLVARGVSYGL